MGKSGFMELGPPQIDIRYRGSSEGRPLEAVLLHNHVDNYDEDQNLLTAPLEVNDSTRLTNIETGRWYITVIRKQRPLPDSPRVALTTAEPVTLYSGRRQVLVFDDFFRVLDPVKNDDATDL